MKKLVAVASLSVGTALSSAAFAQRSAGSEADRLFDEATKDFEAGNVSAACPKFLASYKKHEGTGTLLNLAACWEKQGDLWRAYNAFALARTRAANAAQQERVNLAAGRMRDLEPKVSLVQLSGATTWITSILVEGQTQVGVGPSDPPGRIEAFAVPTGRPITVTISGPGRTLKPEMVLKAGETKTIDIPAATGEPSGAWAAPSTADKEGGGSKALPIALLGAGAVGIVVGSVTGAMALGKASDWNAEARDRYGCNPDNRSQPCTSPDGQVQAFNKSDTHESAQTLATVATISFIAGGVLAATGLTLLFLPSSSSSTAAASAGRTKLVPTAGPGGGGMTFVGTF